MALLMIEGFETVTDVSDILMVTSTTNFSIETTIQRSGRACLKNAGSNTDYLFFPFVSDSNEVYIGFAFRFSSYPGISNYPVFYTIGGTVGFINLVLQTDGELVLRRSSTHLTPSSDANKLAPDTWYYIEIKMVKANSISAGDVQVLVDGVQWITLDAGQDTLYSTEPAYTDGFGFYGYPGSIRYYDDIYVCDETGAVNNTFLGPVKVAALYPNGEGNVNQFTGSDANSTDNHLHVDDVAGQDGDTSYVESDTVDHMDLYTFDDTAADVGTIHGIDVISVVKNDVMGGGAARQGAPIVRVGGTNYQGDTFGVGFPYTHKHHILEANPGDAAAWETADLDAAEFGIKVVA